MQVQSQDNRNANSITEEDDEETASDHNLQVRKLAADDVSFNVDSPRWSAKTKIQHGRDSSLKHFNQLDSEEKQIRWTGRTNLSQSHAAIFVQFCERLAIRDALCGVHDYLQQLESIFLTMCCKENPDLYNSLIVDLQGFVDVKKSSHFEVLAVVRIQSERLTEIVSRYVSTKYNMSKFAELMQSIMSPGQMQSIGSDQNNQEKVQKSFSFEVSTGGVRKLQSSDDGNLHTKQKRFQNDQRSTSGGKTNPFILEQVSSPEKFQNQQSLSYSQISTPSADQNQITSDHHKNHGQNTQVEMQYYLQNQSPSSPLNVQEVQICNEMIEKLRADCQDYEQTIVDQHREISELKKIVSTISNQKISSGQRLTNQIDELELKSLVKRLQQEINTLSEDNQQKQIQIANGNDLITSMQQQIKDLKSRLVQEDNNYKNKREGEFIHLSRQFETLRTENEQLKQRFHDMQALCRVKEQQMANIEQQAHNTLLNAQKDAEECIQYFKQLALSNQQKQQDQLEPILLKSGAMVPQTLAPLTNPNLKENMRENYTGNLQYNGRQKSPVRSLEMPKHLTQCGTSFVNLKTQLKNLTNQDQNQIDSDCLKLQVVLNELSNAFQEVSTLKQGVISQVTQYRDLYVDQIKQFSVLTYDYLEKIDVYLQSHQQYQLEIENYNNNFDQLKQVSLQQTKHIRAQNELVLAQKEKISHLTDFMEKQLRRKERERQLTVKFMFNELPLLSQTISQTIHQVGELQNSDFQNKTTVQDLLQGHDLAKKKTQILEDELEKCLSSNENLKQQLQQNKQKYDRLTELIQDIWQVEVHQNQQPVSVNRHQFTFDRRAELSRSEGVCSASSQLSTETVPMPVNWLSEIREKIRQLKELNDCQKDECYQMLNLLNTSLQNETDQLVQTETDGQTLQQTIEDDDDSSRGIADLGSQMCNSDEKARQNVNKIDSQRNKVLDSQRYNLSSPSDNSRVMSGKSNRKILIQHMTEKHEFNDKNKRSISADNQRVPTSQRTPKNVSFSNNILTSIPSSDPAKKIFVVPKLATNIQPRNELHQILRDEIQRLKNDYAVSRGTIIQMKADIKALRKQNQEQIAVAEQTQFELQNLNNNQGQLLQDFEEAQQHIEELEENLQQRDTTINSLKKELQNFENDFNDLQRQLQNVAGTNNEISQQCEHWELCHQAAQQELVHVRQLHDQKVQKIQESHEEKLKLQKRKLQEKESLIQDTLVMLEREKEFRQAIETKRQNVSEGFTETQPFLQQIENENESLRTQLHQVKQDITAVLEQYDKEHSINKQLKKKLEQSKSAHKQLIDELNQARKEMDLIGKQLNQMQTENDQLQIAIQHQQNQYQQEIQQEHHVNEQLQAQVEQVTQLTEDLQSQIVGSTNDNGDLSRRVIIQEDTIRQLESKIRESLAERNDDKKKIQRLREKLLAAKRQRGSSHHAHSQLVGQERKLTAEKRFASQHSISDSQSDFATQTRQNAHKLRIEADDRNHALDETEVTSNRFKRIERHSQKAISNERPYSEMLAQNNSLSTQNINYSLPPTQNRQNNGKNHFQAQHNPFTNISNLSGVFDSQIGTQDNRVPSVLCCCGNKNCFSAQNASRNPSCNLPTTDTQNNLQFYELKWKAESKEITRRKVQAVLKHIEDLLKHFCKQIVEQQQPNKISQSSSVNLQKHVKEWSADMLLDCWNTQEADLIDAKAYFNKYSPSILTCLKLLVDNNVKLYQDDMQRLNNAPPTLASSRFENPLPDREIIKQKLNAAVLSSDKLNSDHHELIEAYQQLAQHCQVLLQKYLQIGRSLAGICFGGCLLVGQNFNQQTRDQVDFAMKFLAQDTSLIESTSNDTLDEIVSVQDNLLNCLQQIVKQCCQSIINRSSLSKIDANRMLESVQQSCDYSLGPKTTKTNHSVSQSNQKVLSAAALNQQTFAMTSLDNGQNSVSIREKLLDVENRIKQKFQHVSKLETSLDQLLSKQNESQSNHAESYQDNVSSNTSMLTDTKTVMKLLTTVKRVVSKLKIELHQDYLQLGNINVGMLQTASQASISSLTQTQNTNEAQVLSGIKTPTLQANQFSVNQISGQLTDQESKESLQPKNQMVGKIIEEMRGLTFEKENRPSRRTIKSHQV